MRLDFPLQFNIAIGLGAISVLLILPLALLWMLVGLYYQDRDAKLSHYYLHRSWTIFVVAAMVGAGGFLALVV